MEYNTFALFIDELREARNISKDDFLDGIISKRQYYRFLKGESTLKSDITLKLLKRLELQNAFFNGYFQKLKDEEYNKLMDIYENIFFNKIDLANRLFKKLDLKKISDSSNIKFYHYLRLKLLNLQDQINYEDAAKELIQIVNYEQTLTKDVLTFTEKAIFLYISNYLMKQKDYRIIRFFKNIVDKETENNTTLDYESIIFRVTTSKNLTIIGDIEDAYKIINATEKRFKASHDYLPMVNLYFYKAYQEKKLYNDTRYIKSLQKLIGLINLSDIVEFKEKHYGQIEKTFGFKVTDLVIFK